MDLFKSWLVEDYIAHRGLHNSKDAPENSLKAFKNAIDAGYPIELDVQMIEDGTIVVFHDESLSRVVGKDGYVKNLKKEQLKDCYLLKSDQTIPTFEEVLNLVNGQVPLLIEVKNSGKVGKLESELIKILKDYKGEFAIQAFNPFVLQYFRINAPEIIRGQLSSFFTDNNEVSRFRKYFLKRMFFNKRVSKPHFISYRAIDLPNRYVKRFNHLPLLAWTIRSQEEYLKVIKHCDNIIFENFTPRI